MHTRLRLSTPNFICHFIILSLSMSWSTSAAFCCQHSLIVPRKSYCSQSTCTVSTVALWHHTFRGQHGKSHMQQPAHQKLCTAKQSPTIFQGHSKKFWSMMYLKYDGVTPPSPPRTNIWVPPCPHRFFPVDGLNLFLKEEGEEETVSPKTE